MMFARKQTVDPAVVVGDEWRNMTWSARLLVRIASPNMAKAARYLADNPPAYTNVPVMGVATDGPVTRMVDGWFAGSRR